MGLVGAFSTAMFHLMTHAFFKAVLFLGAGAVIHAVGGEQDLRKMGGLYRFLPWTGTAMLLGALSMVGIPGFAGFFSKDGVLLGAWAGGHRGIWILGALGAGLTGFYIFRLWFLVFIGKSRLSPGTEPHEAPFSMRSALVVLGPVATMITFAIATLCDNDLRGPNLLVRSSFLIIVHLGNAALSFFTPASVTLETPRNR